MKKVLYSLVTIFTFLQVVKAQPNFDATNWCSSDHVMTEHFKKHPEMKKKFEAYQTSLASQTNAQKNNASVSYTIPVVFHVLHQNGIENITDAQIVDQIAIFNRDFNLQNADTSVVIPSMKNAIGNVNISFELAKLDPNGNCTSGINRYFDSKTLSWQGDWSDYIYTWPSSQYLNIYVVKSIASGAAGYAYYPGSLGYDDPMDAILILQDYVGSMGTSQPLHARALTHEVGHWLNLAHVWGSTNNPGVACGDDGVNDTPITKGYTSCSNATASQVCNVGVSENYQNYMDYSYCCVMFTNGQATRMRNALNNGVVGRNNLWAASNLTTTGISPAAPCAPIANFSSDRTTICIGQSVVFSDQSAVWNPSAWAWNFESGSPSTSSISNPTVTYNTPGTYSVQLVASNFAGSSAPKVKNFYITVLPAPINTFFTESFENTAAIPDNRWWIKNSEAANLGWQVTSLTASTGTNSIYVDESIAPSSTVEVYSPTFNFSAMPNLALTLKWAGSERESANTTNDIFSLQFSTNCGLTWTPRLTKTIKATTTGVSPSVNGGFIPTSSQFRQEIIPLAGITGATNILFKLKFISEGELSNNFYVDDINLTTTTGLKDQVQLLNVSTYPSPANETVNLSFDLLDNKSVSIALHDLLGKEFYQLSEKRLNAGHYDYNIPVSELSSGVYFIKIFIDGTNYTQKIVVE